jgi:hypothetical protein
MRLIFGGRNALDYITLPLSELDASIRVFVEVCGLALVRNRCPEGGGMVSLGPAPAPRQVPNFVLVVFRGDVKEPIDHPGP